MKFISACVALALVLPLLSSKPSTSSSPKHKKTVDAYCNKEHVPVSGTTDTLTIEFRVEASVGTIYEIKIFNEKNSCAPLSYYSYTGSISYTGTGYSASSIDIDLNNAGDHAYVNGPLVTGIPPCDL